MATTAEDTTAATSGPANAKGEREGTLTEEAGKDQQPFETSDQKLKAEPDAKATGATAASPAAEPDLKRRRLDASSPGICSVCKTKESGIWRFVKGGNDLVCNRCYLEKNPRPPMKPEVLMFLKADNAQATAQAEQKENELKAQLKAELKKNEAVPVKKEPDGARCPYGFLLATPKDHAEIEPKLDEFMDWLVNVHGKTEGSAKTCKTKVLKSFRHNSRAISCIGTPEYRTTFHQDDIDRGDGGMSTALSQFMSFYNDTSFTRSKKVDALSPSPDIKAEPKMSFLLKEELKIKPKVEEPLSSPNTKADGDASDTEYPDVDLQTFPATLRVESSGLEKIDGTYARMRKAHRGRAAYVMDGKDEKKEKFMYWRKSQWWIGLEVGSNKSLAKVQSREGLLHPCEPYPYTWNVYHKDPGDWFEAVCLRIVDVEATSKSAAGRALPKEPSVAGAVAASPRVRHRHRHGSEKDPEKAIAKAEKAMAKAEMKAEMKAEIKAEKMAEKDSDKQSQPATTSEKPENDAAKAASPGDDSKKAIEKELASSSSEESDSDSESESSSSGSGASSGEEAPKTSPAAPALPAAAAAPSPIFNEQKAKVFEGKIRLMLKQCKTPADADKKLGMFVVQMKTYMATSTLSKEQLMELKDKLVKEFVTGRKLAEANAAATAAATAASQPALPSGPQGTELPVTPPDHGPQPGQDLTNHRKGVQPGRSILKRRGAPRNVQKRISHVSRAEERPVNNFRGYLDQLWFVAPGAVVSCDGCHMEVPQSMGCLQGAPGRSQFAQLTFLCTTCMSQ